MNTFYMAAAYLALLITLCRGRKRWVLLGVVLFNLVPNLFFSVQSAPARYLAYSRAAVGHALLCGDSTARKLEKLYG